MQLIEGVFEAVNALTLIVISLHPRGVCCVVCNRDVVFVSSEDFHQAFRGEHTRLIRCVNVRIGTANESLCKSSNALLVVWTIVGNLTDTLNSTGVCGATGVCLRSALCVSALNAGVIVSFESVLCICNGSIASRLQGCVGLGIACRFNLSFAIFDCDVA